MSIRIHALAKELNVPSKELIDFINQRKDKYGLEIKTPSNAIAPLYVDDISADFKQWQQSQPQPEAKPKAEKKTATKKAAAKKDAE